ncbi:MAG: secondary thiamine-phosphate synthase enzyme YjbQ [Candidatus Omnitrophica bacterium]|nr:secondary thiamine-phosphate synthase enzyme YjbQ [Candidatus Omnitrophota bacterium]
MKIKNYTIKVQTDGYCSIHDLTQEADSRIKESGVRSGQATFFVAGSTAGITTVEFEPGLVKDLEDLFEKLAPQSKHYHHEETWHDGNGFSHVRASMVKPSLTVPLIDGKLTLGMWQQVVLIDFDNTSRTRQIILQVMGE